MTILIAGGCGFIGLALSERLLADGAAVVAFDRNPPPAAAARRFADLPGTWTAVAGDVRDPDFVKPFMDIWLGENTSEPELRAALLNAQ